MYGGSFAAKQVLENVVRAMKRLEAHHDILVLLVGDGIRKTALEEEVRRLNVPRVRFLQVLGPAEYARTLRGADLLILNQSRDLIDALTPSKLLTYMLAEKPVIAAVNEKSDAAKIIIGSGCGVVIEAENPERFAESVLEMKSRPGDLRRMGEAGHRFVRENYAKDNVLSRFAEFLKPQYHS
jgi:glycosyltransferase involved in cell wall biosynthesis